MSCSEGLSIAHLMGYKKIVGSKICGLAKPCVIIWPVISATSIGLFFEGAITWR